MIFRILCYFNIHKWAPGWYILQRPKQMQARYCARCSKLHPQDTPLAQGLEGK